MKNTLVVSHLETEHYKIWLSIRPFLALQCDFLGTFSGSFRTLLNEKILLGNRTNGLSSPMKSETDSYSKARTIYRIEY
jgi:hypothetical protein